MAMKEWMMILGVAVLAGSLTAYADDMSNMAGGAAKDMTKDAPKEAAKAMKGESKNAKAEEEIKALTGKFADGWAKGDVKARTALWAADGSVINPGGVIGM